MNRPYRSRRAPYSAKWAERPIEHGGIMRDNRQRRGSHAADRALLSPHPINTVTRRPCTGRRVEIRGAERFVEPLQSSIDAPHDAACSDFPQRHLPA
mgnify:CR=1 FL=1|jgi:hypothetical protein